MKKSALIYFLWSKNLAVLDHYLSNRVRVVITLNEYVTTEMQDIIRSKGSELVILQNLLSQSESHKILEKSRIAINDLSKNSENDWIDYLKNLGINPQEFNLSLEKISETCLNSILTIIECLKKASAYYFIELLAVSEEWLIAGKSAVSWAKAQGIPCLHLVHALSISRYYTVHSKVVSDIIAIYSEIEIDSLINIGVLKNRIRTTGNPAWDQYPVLRTQRNSMRAFIFQKYGLNKTLPLIVFGTTWDYYGTAIHDPDDIDFGVRGSYDRTLYLFFKACRDLVAVGKPANFLIKDRPANASFDGLSAAKKLAKKAGFQSEQFFYATEDTAELVIAADIIVSVGSNLSIEAIIAGTPAINLIDDAQLRLGPHFDVYSGILEVEPDQLPAAILSILENEPFRNKLLELMRDKVNYYNIDDGKASIRVAELITEMALDRSQFDYLNWLERHTYRSCPREVNKTPLLSRIPSIQPTIHLIIIAQRDQEAFLKQTCITLHDQYYENWHLTVVADFRIDLEPAVTGYLSWKAFDSLDKETVTRIIDSIIQEDSADWFGLVPTGLRFDPHSLEIIAAHLNLKPQWRLIYTDSDCIDSQDKRCEPQFRPDFNLDLLLSMPYIGEFCLVQREALLEVGGFSVCSGAENYDLTLRIFDCFGEQAIGHIDELCYHAPKILKTYFYEEFGRLALSDHFERKKIQADISQGYQSGIFFSDYHYNLQPSVSIMIPLIGDDASIKSCIGSILSKTTYLNYELLLINDRRERPEVDSFLQELGLQERIFFINNPKNYSSPSAINLAANQARGDYLLLLNSALLVIQENWLERLLTYALRQDVGVVGCRLVLPDQSVKGTGVILGKKNSIAYPIQYSNIQDAGYMGRGLATQNFSAVTADCLLISKELFFNVGSLDEKNFSKCYYDLDLCLKVKQQGYRIVWTPYVTLLNRSSEVTGMSEAADNYLESQKFFIKKWLHEIAHDPAYNRILSLRRSEWAIEGDFDVPWHSDLEPLPRIVAQAPDEWGVGQYRVIAPLKELTNHGYVCSFMLPVLSSDKRFLPSVAELARAKPTVLFLQNAFSDFYFNDLQLYAECLPDIFRVFGQDDIVFAVPQKSAARKHFGKDTKAKVRRAVSFCHRVIATTEPIAEALRGMCNDIRVMPNYLERSRWGDLQPPRKERRKPRVGWAGAQQHGGDLEFILPVVEATANEVDWIFMGLCLPKLRYYIAEVHDAVFFDQYPAALAALDLDLAIAPLELNQFNSAKSNLRLLEYGAVGYPVIATDILPYQNAPVTRVPNNPKAWIDAIREHVHELDATHATGEQLRKWVLSQWMLDQHLDEWLRALLPG